MLRTPRAAGSGPHPSLPGQRGGERTKKKPGLSPAWPRLYQLMWHLSERSRHQNGGKHDRVVVFLTANAPESWAAAMVQPFASPPITLMHLRKSAGLAALKCSLNDRYWLYGANTESFIRLLSRGF